MKNNMEEKTNATRAEKFSGREAKEVFTEVFMINDWSSNESHSGMGSTLEFTSNTRKRLTEVWKKYNIKKVLDIGCGDFNWMKEIIDSLDYYKGTDIVNAITDLNKERYEEKGKIEFETHDILNDPLVYKSSEFDAIILKDVLVHFPDKNIPEVLDKIKNTGIKYVFITHFVEISQNSDIKTFGGWRPLNMKMLGDPIEIINEELEEYKWGGKTMKDKTLSLWKFS